MKFFSSLEKKKRTCRAVSNKKFLVIPFVCFFPTVVWSWCSQYFWFIFFIISYYRWAFSEFFKAINMGMGIHIISNFIVVFISTLGMSVCVKRYAKVLIWKYLLGSFSRSAVNHESGAKTGLSGIVTGVIMGCALLFLTPLFEFIPQVCFLQVLYILTVNISVWSCLWHFLLLSCSFVLRYLSEIIGERKRTVERVKEENCER